ncbi:MAG: GNAT family N-acetyltransferase [Bacteroidetes bacterium]|nr:GNAT family N-acetyltransferase [Bacteroidota bacterium]
MVIRQASLLDVFYIQKLLGQLGYPDASLEMVSQKIQLHEDEDYHLLVAEDQSEVIAFISLHRFEFLHAQGKIGRITAFCVEERYRSKGVGAMLLAAAEKYLTEQGCTKLEVTSNLARERTHQFYLQNGYLIDSKRFVKYVQLSR